MPPEIFVFLVAMAVMLAVSIALVLTRGQTLDRIRDILKLDDGEDLEAGARSTKDALAAARFEEERLRGELQQLVDQLETAVLRLGDDQRVVMANRAAGRLSGGSVAPLTGRSVMEIFVDHHLEAIVASTLVRGTASGEIGLRAGVGIGGSRDSAERTLLVRGRRAAGGGVWLVMDDVSELRRLRRIRSEFIDNLAHELRTPLTTVRLLTETVMSDLKGADLPRRLRDRIAKIDIETGHLVQMVNELLDLSRIEGGASAPRLERVEMPGMIESAMDRMRPFADRHEVELLADLPADGALPAVSGDSERLGQLLVNLLHNAVKFSPESSRVVIGAHTLLGEVVVTVSDQGAGIPRADLDRVFERFYKVDKARVRGMGGTGLGLAIARHIVESHGGRIWAESKGGRGSTFSFTIPAAEEQ